MKVWRHAARQGLRKALVLTIIFIVAVLARHLSGANLNAVQEGLAKRSVVGVMGFFALTFVIYTLKTRYDIYQNSKVRKR
jgi:hypothetical protein